MRFVFVAIILFLVLGLVPGCSFSSGGSSAVLENKKMPLIIPQELALDGCINITFLQSRFEESAGHYPALVATTDFQADPDLSVTKIQFQTYASFDLRDIETQDIQFLIQPVQEGCSRVRAKTVSGEELVFQISQQRETGISLSLQDPSNADLSRYRKEGLRNKRQPIRYDVSIIAPTHLRIQTTYRGFDPHCRSQRIVISKIQRDYYWAPDSSSLPIQVGVQQTFLQSFLSTLQPQEAGYYEIVSQEDGFALVNVSDMRSLLTKSVKDELSKCVF